MAEPKHKNINGSHARTKSPPKQSKMWQLLDLAKEVSRDADAVQQFEKSVEGRRVLEQELEAKAGENQKLRQVNDKILREFSEFRAQASAKAEMVFAEFEQRFKTYDSNKAAVEAAKKELAEMKQIVEEWEAANKSSTDELDQLKQRLQIADAKAKSQKEEINELNAECAIQKSQMDIDAAEFNNCQEKLAQAQKDLGEGVLREYDSEELKKLGLDLQALSERLHALVIEYFNDLDSAKHASSGLHDLGCRFAKVPVSGATTRAAAYMRCAVAEAVFADVLTTQIFVPFYLANEAKTAASSLLAIFGDDEHRRSIYRCQILQVKNDSAEAARVEEDIVGRATSETVTTLHSLVAQVKYSGFFHAVPAFFREAVKLWKEVQHSRELITAEMPDLDEVQPGKYEDYDQGGAPTSPTREAKASSKPVMAAALFPQVSTREHVIFNGMALWSNQGAYTAALSESPVNMNGVAMETPRVRKRSMVGSESPFRSK